MTREEDNHPAKKQSTTIDAWVARDDNETIRLWDGCPYRSFSKCWFSICSLSTELPSESFPEVTFENSPKKVKVTIELEDKEPTEMELK